MNDVAVCTHVQCTYIVSYVYQLLYIHTLSGRFTFDLIQSGAPVLIC